MADELGAEVQQTMALPKWPEMRVSGTRVSAEQAQEIIIRTDSFFDWGSCNDKEWCKALGEVMGVEWADYHLDWEGLKKASERVGHLRLNYLSNDQIASSYIGGPHGWCGWLGEIKSAGHNIGKWPSVKVVHEDWAAIAAEFPFLDLRCQLFTKEGGEEGPDVVVVEYVVRGGEAKILREPGATLPAGTRSLDSELVQLFSNPFRERGCSLEMFRKAYERVVESRKAVK